MEAIYSPRASKAYASEVNLDGFVIDEDIRTSAVGYRWLHATCAPKAFLPRHSTFVSFDFSADKSYHPSQTVIDVHDFPRRLETVFDHMLWAVENEGLEMQILKICMINSKEAITSAIVTANEQDRCIENFRRLWFLFEYWTGLTVPVPNCYESLQPILLVDPEIYVAGPCMAMNPRQRYVALPCRANGLDSSIICLEKVTFTRLLVSHWLERHHPSRRHSPVELLN